MILRLQQQSTNYNGIRLATPLLVEMETVAFEVFMQYLLMINIIFILRRKISRISKWPPIPNGLASAAIFQTANGELYQPPSVYVNTKTGDIYVANEQNEL